MSRHVVNHREKYAILLQIVQNSSRVPFCYVLLILILLSGDIQENPGPDSVSSLADEESDLSPCSTDSLDHLFSIMHLNIQSIVPKLDLVETESLAYDIMVYSESWPKPTVSNDSACVRGFPMVPMVYQYRSRFYQWYHW